MNKVLISFRLETICKYVYPYRSVIDVGTDHCFIPIFLVQNDIIDSAIATDINLGPINEAKKNISNYELDKFIDARCGNGLSTITINDKVDVIIIAGMGGKLITDILETGRIILPFNKRLILQPNVAEDIVRRWLCENHYEIVNEEIIKDDNKIYEIISANKVNDKVNLSEEEITFGPILSKQQSSLFYEKWESVLMFKKQLLKRIPDYHENKNIILNDIEKIEKIINSKNSTY